MTRQLTIQDAAQHFNVSERTIRRHIKQGTLKADLIDGRYQVCVDSDMTPDKPEVNALSCQLERADFEIQHLTELVEEKTNQILYLRDMLTEKDEQLTRRDEQIDHLTQLLAMQTKTTVALTEQLDAERALIEDLRRRKPSVWKRIFR